MSKHLKVIEKDLRGATIRANGEAMGMAVAVTDQEIITGAAGFLWGEKIKRFPLSAVSSLRTIPNPSANMLEIEFAKSAPESSLTIMYRPEAQSDFERIITLLRQRIGTVQQ